jgi:hypothetical protein
MAKFDYKKWVTDYKYSGRSLFEQNSTGSAATGSATGSASTGSASTGSASTGGASKPRLKRKSRRLKEQFSTGSMTGSASTGSASTGSASTGSASTGGKFRNPRSRFNKKSRRLEEQVNQWSCPQGTSMNYQACNTGSMALSGWDPGTYLGEFIEDVSQWINLCCTGGNTPGAEATASICCDLDAVNFGQTADGGTWNYQFGQIAGFNNSAEEYIMYYGPEGEFCDNSICYGSVSTPDYQIDPNTQNPIIPGAGPQPMPPQGLKGKQRIKRRRGRQGIRRQSKRARQVSEGLKQLKKHVQSNILLAKVNKKLNEKYARKLKEQASGPCANFEEFINESATWMTNFTGQEAVFQYCTTCDGLVSTKGTLQEHSFAKAIGNFDSSGCSCMPCQRGR